MLEEDGIKGSGRLQLARWIADPKNPLTARVMVNRIWTTHFGRGIVATPSNFGKQGQAIVLPGGGPPPHIHRKEDETFYILEGEITFQIGGERRVAGPGTFVHMPIGNLHAFKNETDQPVKMLVSFVPAGLEGMFFQVGKDLADGEVPEEPSPQEVDRLLEIADRYGIEYHLPPH